jgi:hypothetical protein
LNTVGGEIKNVIIARKTECSLFVVANFVSMHKIAISSLATHLVMAMRWWWFPTIYFWLMTSQGIYTEIINIQNLHISSVVVVAAHEWNIL